MLAFTDHRKEIETGNKLFLTYFLFNFNFRPLNKTRRFSLTTKSREKANAAFKKVYDANSVTHTHAFTLEREGHIIYFPTSDVIFLILIYKAVQLTC